MLHAPVSVGCPSTAATPVLSGRTLEVVTLHTAAFLGFSCAFEVLPGFAGGLWYTLEAICGANALSRPVVVSLAVGVAARVALEGLRSTHALTTAILP